MTLALLASAAACSKDTTAPVVAPPAVIAVRPTVRAVAGAAVTDTAGATLIQALIVEVRGTNGQPAAGVVVRFEPAAPADPVRRAERAVLVCTLVTSVCDGATADRGLFAAQRTDSVGRAKVTVRLGTVAGRATVRLSVPEMGIVDSATYVVTHGAPARVRFAVRDTAIALGSTTALGPALTDRNGNLVDGAVALTVSGTLVEPVGDGAVAARALGRAVVTGRVGTMVDSSIVTVVPTGRFVAYAPGGIDGRDAIVSVRFDGSDQRVLSVGNGTSDGGWPSWSPDGRRVVFHGGYSTPQLRIAGVDEPEHLFTLESVVEAYPQWSADGQWIYYTRSGQLWRMSPDRTQSGSVRGLGGYAPAPSPDGQRVAYTDGGLVFVANLSGGIPTRSGLTGTGARWSPDGQWLAVASGVVQIIRADGTGLRTLSQPGDSYLNGVSWSPDGRYLLARVDYSSSSFSNQLRIIDVANGSFVALRFGGSWVQPAWSPIP